MVPSGDDESAGDEARLAVLRSEIALRVRAVWQSSSEELFVETVAQMAISRLRRERLDAAQTKSA